MPQKIRVPQEKYNQRPISCEYESYDTQVIWKSSLDLSKLLKIKKKTIQEFFDILKTKRKKEKCGLL